MNPHFPSEGVPPVRSRRAEAPLLHDFHATSPVSGVKMQTHLFHIPVRFTLKWLESRK
jgi:hypothetical protein